MVTSQSLNTSQDKAAHQTNKMSNKTRVTYKTPKNPSPHGYKFKGEELPVSSNFPEFISNKQVSERSQILIDCLFRQENRLEKIKLLHHLTAHISEIEAKVKQLELQEQASTARESLIKEFQIERSSSQALGEGVPASNLFSNPASAKGVSVPPLVELSASEIEAFKRDRPAAMGPGPDQVYNEEILVELEPPRVAASLAPTPASGSMKKRKLAIPSTKLSDTSPAPSSRPSDFSPATLWQEVAEGALSGHKAACEALATLIPTVVTTLGSKADKIEGELAVSESKVTRLSTYLEELAGENRKLKDALAAQDSSWESLEGKAASLEEELREARQHSQLLSTHFDAVLSYEKATVDTVGVSFPDTSLETEGVTVATNAGFKVIN